MGYEPANRQTTPDFLVAVTDPNGRIARPGVTNIPRTADEFAEYFKNSEAYKLNQEDISAYMAGHVGLPEKAHAYKESAREEHSKGTKKTSPYTISIPMQARAVMTRRVQILYGNKLAVGLNLAFVFPLLCVVSWTNVPVVRSSFKLSSSVRLSSRWLHQRRHISLVEVYYSCTYPNHCIFTL